MLGTAGPRKPDDLEGFLGCGVPSNESVQTVARGDAGRAVASVAARHAQLGSYRSTLALRDSPVQSYSQTATSAATKISR